MPITVSVPTTIQVEMTESEFKRKLKIPSVGPKFNLLETIQFSPALNQNALGILTANVDKEKHWGVIVGIKYVPEPYQFNNGGIAYITAGAQVQNHGWSYTIKYFIGNYIETSTELFEENLIGCPTSIVEKAVEVVK